ncbi:unnamed protein product [Moneuplotes crassus]|uniref:Uncharacterized protein n=1 Tax=Euplotes crassus TaxID=5936 RepID=A0AAD2CW32_EUPCR|nr:unnamed protein product [Moneuplotes crassus]
MCLRGYNNPFLQIPVRKLWSKLSKVVLSKRIKDWAFFCSNFGRIEQAHMLTVIENKVDSIILDNDSVLKNKGKYVVKFLERAFPKKLKEFSLDSRYSQDLIALKKFRSYSQALCRNFCRISEKLEIVGFVITRQDLCRIISNCSHLNSISIKYCRIDSEGCKFISSKDYKVQSLCLTGCGQTSCSNWGEYQHRFTSILKAISDCSLKTSLKSLVCYDSLITEEEMLYSIQKHKFKGLTVQGQYTAIAPIQKRKGYMTHFKKTSCYLFQT